MSLLLVTDNFIIGGRGDGGAVVYYNSYGCLQKNDYYFQASCIFGQLASICSNTKPATFGVVGLICPIW